MRPDPRVAAVLGAALAAAMLLAVWRWGSVAALGLFLAVVFTGLCLMGPRPALAGFVALVALAETDPDAGIISTAPLYSSITAVITPVALMFAVCAASVVLLAVRPGGGFRLPRPFTLPLVLYAVALALGSVVGQYGGSSAADTVGALILLVPLIVLPLLIATVARRPGDGRRMVGIGFGLGVARAVLGLAAFFTVGTFDPALGDRSTSYEPTSNWLIMLVLLGLVGALLARTRLSAWVLAALPLAAIALTLSYRRSFWIAALLGVVVVAIVASGRVGRRFILPAMAVVGVGIYLTLSSGLTGDLEGPVAQRVQSLDPSKVAASEQDRYRIGERRNVIAEIQRHPLVGIGTGVDWRGRYAVTLGYENQRNYVHMGVLWHWLKLGLLGAVAYLWLFGAALVCGLGVFRRHPDPIVGLAGLAVGVGAAGLAVAELTASWIGPEPRLTIVFGAALGFLAVARREAAERRLPPIQMEALPEPRVGAPA